MEATGQMLLGGREVTGSGSAFFGFDPAQGAQRGPEFRCGTVADVAAACALADAAAPAFRATTPEARAVLLDTIAANIEAAKEALVTTGMAETGLPRVRLEGETGRTAGQLRLFARVLRDGAYLDVRVDHALPERTPPRADIRLTNVPLGPVAVFGASNFPLAFSVAGGDTASALAAGCPVVVKAHSAHPATSEIAGRAVAAAVASCGLPEGVFSLLFGAGNEVGAALVADPRIQAVGFTGSRGGGLALVKIAQSRPVPIPVYAELSAINPVILLPGALAARGKAIGTGFAAALTMGAGQFCTNPGLLLALEGSDIDGFVEGAGAALASAAPATMLTPGIHAAYTAGVAKLDDHAATTLIARGADGEGYVARSSLFETKAADFLAHHDLHDEVFGATSLLVRCKDVAELMQVLQALEGQLTLAVHADGAEDLALAAPLMPVFEKKAGRVLFNGFGTGVEVCDAMVHGGPFPATSDARSTSVGSLAIARFVRPVCFQDVPDALLPAELKHGNPLGLPRRIDGVRG